MSLKEILELRNVTEDNCTVAIEGIKVKGDQHSWICDCDCNCGGGWQCNCEA